MNTNRLYSRGAMVLVVCAIVLAMLGSRAAQAAPVASASSVQGAPVVAAVREAAAFQLFLPALARNTWQLVWSDEFGGAGGVSKADWLYDIGTSYPGGPANWGTGEIETMTSSTDNVYQAGGALHIRALHTGSDPVKGWTSGRIETSRTDFEAPPGGQLAVEARIWLPDVTNAQAQGYWPAFWMLGAAYRGNYWNWPGVGEVDIMENVNGSNTWWGTLHCGTTPGGPCNETNGLGYSVPGFSPSLQSTFHIYRVEIDRSTTSEQLRWYMDGLRRFTLKATAVDAATWSKAIHHGFFIILNVAMGGGWPGNPTTSTASGAEMQVDSVRVYVEPALQ